MRRLLERYPKNNPSAPGVGFSWAGSAGDRVRANPRRSCLAAPHRPKQKFVDIPRYLAVLSSRPLEEMTGEVIRERLSLGLEAFVDQPGITVDRGGAEQPFREALVRLKMRDGMFFEMGRGVTFITPAIFRAGIPLTADAPPGNYEVEVLLFTDGIMLAREVTNFELVKTGFEQQLPVMAENNSALYGGLTAMMALFFGWLASVIFRRD